MKQNEKVLTIMIRNHQRRWWYPPDFMRPPFAVGELYVGYEASARLSGLARRFPEMLETRISPTDPKYKERRFRFENVPDIVQVLPDGLRRHVVAELAAVGIVAENAVRQPAQTDLF